jgi:Tol biopolymer transport system component/DNA-binding winged helix-turn-helix (wHTH) protein
MSGEAGPSYEFGPFRLDVSEHRLLREGRALRLTPKTFAVLRVLVENAGHLVDKERLMTEVWAGNFVEEGALNRSVSVIRKTLGESADRKYIDTIPKRGYRFVAEVTVRRDVPSRSARAVYSAHHWRTMAAGAVLIVGAITATIALRYRHTETVAASSPLRAAHTQVTFSGNEGGAALSPDGRRIAYLSSDGVEKRVLVRDLTGGSPLTILAAPEAGYLSWSPDGTELLVWARGAGYNGIYRVAQLGGTPHPVAPGMYVSCWMNDGATVAVPSYIGGTISFYDRSGGRQRSISLRDVSWSIWSIDWSPTAGRLALTSSDEQGRFTLWTVRPDGSEQTRVLTSSTAISSARWSPRGDAIYYMRQVSQTDSLYRIQLDATRSTASEEAISLLTGLETDHSFALSADGRRLVYSRAPFHSNFWTIDLDGAGGTPRELTQGTSLVERPHMSPDGQSIAFSMGRDPTVNVYTMPTAGGPSKQLTYLEGLNLAGGWSTDGRAIAFASNHEGMPRVWTVGAEGGPPRARSTGEMSESFEVAWSPGSAILYQQVGNRNYYELDPSTGVEKPLVSNATVGWMFSPAYSPDGSKIAVTWNRRPARGIWIVDALTHQQRPLYAPAASPVFPIGWSADGTAIYAVEGKTSAIRGRMTPLGETMTNARILMIPVNGDPKTIMKLPSAEIGGVTMTRDARRFVYTVYTSESDVWIVDDFDVTSTATGKQLRFRIPSGG